MTSTPTNVTGLQAAIGDTVPGTQGKAAKDQQAIDIHVARACASNVYSREKCRLHTQASAQRKAELADG